MTLKNNEPFISVIVTTYNRKEFLKETIDSILKQTFRNFELIVVDNYSNYDFNKFIKTFNDDRVVAYQNQNNGVIAVNRNIGIKKAKGEYIAFCDDDDYWVDTKLEKQIDHIVNDDSIIGVGTNAYLFGSVNRLKRKNLKEDRLLSFENIIELKSNIFSSLLIRKENYLFDESEKVKYSEDFDFGLQLVSKSGKPIKLLYEPLVYYRVHENNNVAVFSNSLTAINVIKKYQKYIPKKQLNKLYSKTYANLGSLILYENPSESRKYYYLSMKSGGFSIKISLLMVISYFPETIKQFFLKL